MRDKTPSDSRSQPMSLFDLWSGKDFRNIANVKNVSISTARSRLSDARLSQETTSNHCNSDRLLSLSSSFRFVLFRSPYVVVQLVNCLFNFCAGPKSQSVVIRSKRWSR